MNGISVLIKETPESSLTPSTMKGHSAYEPGSELSLDIKTASALILDLASRL